MLPPAIYELVQNSPFFKDDIEVSKFLQRKNVPHMLNTIHFFKLQLLLKNQWVNNIKINGVSIYLNTIIMANNEDREWVSNEIKDEIFQNDRTIDAINSIDLNKIQYIIQGPPTGVYLISWFINDENALKAINILEAERFEMLLTYDKSRNIAIMKKILVNPLICKAINLINLNKLELIHRYGTFDGKCFADIFGNLTAVKEIASMHFDDIKNLLINGNFCIKLFENGKSFSRFFSGYHIILRSDKYYYYYKTNKKWVDFYKIDFTKMNYLLQSYLFDYKSILRLFESQRVINALNMLNTDKLITLLKIKHSPVETIRNINHDETPLAFRYFLVNIFSNLRLVALLNSCDMEKLELLLGLRRSLTTVEMLEDILHIMCNGSVWRVFCLVDNDKLEALLEVYTICAIAFILVHDRILYFLDMEDIEKLQILIRMMDYENFIKLFEIYDQADVKNNLRYVIALYKAGHVRRVNCEFLRNDVQVQEAIMKAFPKGYPIERVLMKSMMVEEDGSVPSLKGRSLEAAILALKRPPKVLFTEISTCKRDGL